MNKVIYGTWQIGWAPSFKECNKEIALSLLEYAYSKGIRCFDTAPIYGNGQAEEFLWEFLQWKREKLRIISKFWFSLDHNLWPYPDFSKEGIKQQLEDSLSRLQTDYIDIYLLHIPEISLNIPDILETLNELKAEGKIKSYGVCNMYHRQLEIFLHHPLSQAEYVQDFYNIMERKAEQSIFPYLTKKHIFMAYSPLYRWVLTSQNMKDLFARDEGAINMLIKNQDLAKIYKQKLSYEKLSQKQWWSIEALAYNFLKSNPRVQSIVLWSTNTQHINTWIDLMTSSQK